MGEFYQVLKEEITLILHKPFQKIWDGTLRNSFLDDSIIIKPKPDKDITRKLPTNILHELRHKYPKQNTKPNPVTCKRIIYHDQVGFIPGTQS